MNELTFLRIPLHKLYYLDSIADFDGFSMEDLDALSKEYSEDEIKNIKNSVRWAIEHPDTDFQSLLPDLPFSNNEIYSYLVKIGKTLQ